MQIDDEKEYLSSLAAYLKDVEKVSISRDLEILLLFAWGKDGYHSHIGSVLIYRVSANQNIIETITINITC